MITSQQISWIAGLLEGEGTFRFSTSGSPNLRIGMTDLDVIERFRILTKTTNLKISIGPAKPGWKTSYYTSIYGSLAIQWMMTIYSLMGVRRREKIKDIIIKWRTEGYVTETARAHSNSTRERKSIKALAIARNITMEEAEKLLYSLMNKTVQ